MKEQEVIKELEKEDGVVYVNGRIYMPNNQKLKEKILQENHNPADIEHSGQ